MKSITNKMMFLLFLFLILSTHTLANTKPKILIIHSYHPTYKWTKDINDGINSIFNDIKKVDKYVEYMDTKQFFQKEYIKSLTEIYQQKYKNIKFDLIISSDNNAFNFLRLHSKELFQNTPVIFSGVNNFQDAWIKDHSNFTGVVEKLAFKENYDLIIKLHPKVKNIYIIIDNTVTGKAVKEKIKDISNKYPVKNITIHILDNLSNDELLKKIQTLPKNSAILFTFYLQTKDGKFLEYYKLLELLSKVSNSPIYGVMDYTLHHGAIGGYVTTGFYQGVTAAKIAQKILQGIDVRSIPVVQTSPNKYMFDYNQMKKYNIKESQIPLNTTILNKPNNMLDLYVKELITVIVLFIIMFIFIIILLITNKKRAKAEKLAKKQLIFQQNLIDNVNTPIYYKNTNREYIGCNKAFAELMEIDKHSILNKTIDYLNDTEKTDFINQKDVDILSDLQPQEYEGSYKLKDGTYKDLIFNKNVFFEDEQLGGIVGSIFDITEINSLNYDLNRLLSTFDTNVIASKTDIQGKIIYVSQAFIDISKYKQSELVGKNHDILGSGVTKDSVYDELWETITKHKIWTGELINKNKKSPFLSYSGVIMV